MGGKYRPCFNSNPFVVMGKFFQQTPQLMVSIDTPREGAVRGFSNWDETEQFLERLVSQTLSLKPSPSHQPSPLLMSTPGFWTTQYLGEPFNTQIF